MSSQPIEAGYPYLVDLKGHSLDLGYIYIGVAGLDPETNPIVAYWDEALTVSADQPIRTVNGYPVRSGSPGNLYVGSAYSIKVKNKQNELVYTELNKPAPVLDTVLSQFADTSDPTLGDALIGVKQPFGNTVATDQHNKNIDIQSAKDWGVVADGATDDTSRLANYVTECQSEGLAIDLPEGTYLITSLDLNGTFHLRGRGIDKTVIKLADAASKIRVNSGAGITTHNWVIEGLTIDGNNIANNGIVLGQTSVSPNAALGTMRDVYITRTQSVGLLLNAAQQAQFHNVICKGNAGHGMQAIDPLNLTSNTLCAFYDCQFINNTLTGAYVVQYDSFLFDKCRFEENMQEGLLVERQNLSNPTTRNLILRDCYWEQNNDGRVGTGYGQCKIYTLGTTTNQKVVIERPRFIQAGTGNFDMWLGRGSITVIAPDHQVVAASTYIQNTSTAYIDIIDCRYDVASAISLDVSSAANVKAEHNNNGVRRWYYNNAGVMTQFVDWTAGTYGTVNFSSVTTTLRTHTSGTTASLFPYDTVLLTALGTPAAMSVLLTSVPIANKIYYIKDAAGNAGTYNVTVIPQGGKTLDGAASKIINVNYGGLTLIYDGTNWFTLPGKI